MANQIPMTTREAIRALRERGQSKRRIARELGIHRNTVSHYLEEVEGGVSDPKCTTSGKATPGSKCTTLEKVTPGLEDCGGAEGQEIGEGPKVAEKKEQEAKQSGTPSRCEGLRGVIESKLEAGLQAKRIWQDLVEEHGFGHSYQSVKRFVAKLKQRSPERVWRMECEPGEEAQVDYGTMSVEIGGRRRKIHLLRVTLSHSRKGYTEAMPRQDTESFVRGIENAFRHFGGVPRLLLLDNLKAGVLKADVYDPELNPKFAGFCEHYGVTAMPTMPRTPEHKGKVENAVRYVKESAVRGKSFESLHELNRHLRRWEENTADTRIHGTTRRQVMAHFLEMERPALQPLPEGLFPSFLEVRRKVHRDSYVEFERAYYEVPPEYIARELWVRSDGRMVHIFNLRMEQVAVHAKLEAGQFTKVLGCGGTPASVREALRHWQERAAEIGPDVGLWAHALILNRKQGGLRALMAVVHRLRFRHGSAALNQACAQARLHGHYSVRELKNWLEEPARQQSFSFLSEHEVIRDMAAYGRLVGFEQNN